MRSIATIAGMNLDLDKAIVVTGAAGFIGSCTLKHLNERGLTNVIAVDHLERSEKWKNLVGKKLSLVLEREQLFDWLKGKEKEIGAIIHLGACSSTVELDASYLLKNNYQYSVQLAEYALQNDVRFIYASSAATYGDGTKGFEDGYEHIEELEPLNMYGFSKHLFDLWVKRKGAFSKVVGLKYFNVFGPNEYHKGRMCSAILKQYPLVAKGDVVKLFASSEPTKFKDGGQMRDFIYVKDAVRMTCAFLQNKVGGLFNVGSGTPRTWNDLAGAMFSAVNLSPRIEYIPMPGDLIGKYQNYTCADMGRTRNALGGLSYAIPLEESVAEYMKEYLLPERRW